MYLKMHHLKTLKVTQVDHFPSKEARYEFWSVRIVAEGAEESVEFEFFFDQEPVGLQEGQVLCQAK